MAILSHLSLGRVGVRPWDDCPTRAVRKMFMCFLFIGFVFAPKIGVQETVLFVNHALARGTPAIFVIFVVSRGSSSKALVLLVRMQIRHFRHFRPLFLAGQKHGLPKAPFSGPRQNLVVCEFYAEALFCALLRSFALFCGLAFALSCAHLRSSLSFLSSSVFWDFLGIF